MKQLRPVLLLATAAVASAYVAPGGAPAADRKPAPTFAADVAPILFSKCAGCHHAGETAPFSLITYSDAKAKAKTIVSAVKQKYMPPWQAISHGEFANDRTLTPKQIETLEAWANAGAPAGDLKKAPLPPTFTPGWQMGKPDFIGQPVKPYELSAEGSDDYRCFVVPTNFPQNRYVTAVELRPGNRKIVHHVLVYLDTSGTARKKDGKDGNPGYQSFGGPGFPPAGSLGGWAPGLQPQMLDAGSGFLLPKGADIVMQVHYHKDGKPESDLTRIGLRFATTPVDKEVRFEAVGEEVFGIPPGDAAFPVTASMKLPRAVTLLDIVPHMHLLGHDMNVVATLPDGSKKQLIQVENYDFNWQTQYKYKEPVRLPAGTVLSLVAHYDNSSANPRNPNNPPKRVTFGEQTTDEMCYAFFSYTFDAEHLAKGIRVQDSDMASEAIGHIFDKFDANHDGGLDATELAAVIKFFQNAAPGKETKQEDLEKTAKFLVAMYGKEQKGRISKAEFTKLAQQSGK